MTFPRSNVGTYVEYREVDPQIDNEMNDAELVAIELTGENGYRSAVAGHGAKHGDYYFEVEMLPFKTPIPFLNVQPSLRVGLTNFAEQSIEMPIGVSRRSYAYSSSGKVVTNAKFSSKKTNDPYGKCPLA